MADPSVQPELFPGSDAQTGVVHINAQCLIRAQGDRRVVVVRGMPMYPLVAGDQAAEAYVMVLLVEQGWAQQTEVARAFGRTTRSLRRYQARLATGGLVALSRPPGYPKGLPRRPPNRDQLIAALRHGASSNRMVARQLGLDEKTVRKALRRAGWQEPRAVQGVLDLGRPRADPNLSASCGDPAQASGGDGLAGADSKLSAPAAPAAPPGDAGPVDGSDADPPGPPGDADEPSSLSSDADPMDRIFDRLLACLGHIDDAVPIFESAARVGGAGVLLAVPALVESGVFTCARETYGHIGPGFYGLRTTIMTLVLMALLRMKRPEGLKERSPPELGRVLGLDRAPEVKTVRLKLERLASQGGAADFGRALARWRARARGEALGFPSTSMVTCGSITASARPRKPTSPACGLRCRGRRTTGSTTSRATPCSSSRPRPTPASWRSSRRCSAKCARSSVSGGSRSSSIGAGGARRSSARSSPPASTS
jgi:hypothetical protein